MANATLLITPADELHFAGPYTNRGSSTPLRLENKSTDKYLAYKVKTIDTRRYVVKPTNGIIAPGASVDVALSILPLASPEAVKEFLTTKQKFLVQWRVLSTAPEPAETGYALMAKSGGEPVQDHKLLCVFEGPGEEKDCSFHSTTDGSAGTAPVGAEAVQDALVKYKNAQTELNAPVEPAAGCPLGSRLRCPLIGLAVLLLALLVAYFYGHKLQSMLK